MKKAMILSMLAALTWLNTACSSDDPLDSYTNRNTTTDNTGNSGNTSGGSSSSSGSSTATGDLTTFSVKIDKTTAEPTSGIAAAYYPEEEDNLANNSFATQVAIDLSNPVT